MEKQLPVAFDFSKLAYDQERRDTLAGMEYVNPFLEELSTKFKLEITESLATDFVNGNDAVLTAIEKNIKAKLQAAGLNMSSIEAGAVEDATKEYRKIKARYSQRLTSVSTHSLTFDNGQFSFTDENEKQLRERHTSYIFTERGLECYETHQRAIQAFNDLLQLFPALQAMPTDDLIQRGIYPSRGLAVIRKIRYDQQANQ